MKKCVFKIKFNRLNESRRNQNRVTISKADEEMHQILLKNLNGCVTEGKCKFNLLLRKRLDKLE